MTGQRTEQGLEFVLQPCGFGRFFSAAFLGVWLCGWAAGEAFALWLLTVGAYALLTGRPPEPGRAPLELGGAIAAGAFLLFWLSIWTFGGFAALREFVRLLWSRDRIVAGSASLRVLRRLGPFRSTVEIPRDAVRRIYLVRGESTLRAEVESGSVVLSTLGTPAERMQVAAALREELRVPEELELGPVTALPEGWEEILTPEGEFVLVRDQSVRRRQARVALGLTVVVAALAITLVALARHDAQRIGGAAMLSVAAAALAWGTAHLARGRIEWRIRTGSVTRRRRFGARVRDVFEGVRLELIRTSDSDGDHWFKLEAVAPGAVDPDPAAVVRSGRRTIESALRDPAVPRRLGAWLAEHAKLPFDDRCTIAAEAVDRERALKQLRASGVWGRRIAGWIERVEAKHRT